MKQGNPAMLHRESHWPILHDPISSGLKQVPKLGGPAFLSSIPFSVAYPCCNISPIYVSSTLCTISDAGISTPVHIQKTLLAASRSLHASHGSVSATPLNFAEWEES